MFVFESNKSLENDEIRTLEQTSFKNGILLPGLFQLSLTVFIAIKGCVQTRTKQTIYIRTPKKK